MKNSKIQFLQRREKHNFACFKLNKELQFVELVSRVKSFYDMELFCAIKQINPHSASSSAKHRKA